MRFMQRHRAYFSLTLHPLDKKDDNEETYADEDTGLNCETYRNASSKLRQDLFSNDILLEGHLLMRQSPIPKFIPAINNINLIAVGSRNVNDKGNLMYSPEF
jgi:hypothetical protein